MPVLFELRATLCADEMTALDIGACIWFCMSGRGKIGHNGSTTCQSVHETDTKIALGQLDIQCSFRTNKYGKNTTFKQGEGYIACFIRTVVDCIYEQIYIFRSNKMSSQDYSDKIRKPRVTWHHQDVQTLIDIESSTKTPKGVLMTEVLARPNSKNIHLRKE